MSVSCKGHARLTMRLYGVFLCVLAAGTAAPARAERFRYRYRPGQVTVSRASMAGATMMGPTGVSTAGAGGASMLKARFRMSTRQTERVVSVSHGVITLEVTETPLSGSMSG